MRNFYISKIFFTGSHVETSSIDLIDGLNIICGPSDTGKSYIAECFDFMFGGNIKDFPIGLETGYNSIHMIIVTYNGNITLERYFEKNVITVSSSNPDFESDDYSISGTKKNINSLWLQLIGMDSNVKIIKNEETYERQFLTFRSILHTLCIKEENVFQKDSIMYKRSFNNKTALLSSLLYMITGNIFETSIQKDSKKSKEVQKKAVQDYMNSNLSYLADRKAELSEYNEPSVNDVQQKINSILYEISETEGAISIAITQSKNLSNEIYKVNDQLAECDMLVNRFNVLRSQYQSDIKRLTFIVEGDIHKSNIPEVIKCPFCNGELEKEKKESCIEAAHAELEKILPQITDLEDAEIDVLNELDDLQKKSSELSFKHAKIETIINTELRPKITNLRILLDDYRRSIEVHHEYSVIKNLETNMTESFYFIDDGDELDFKFKPTEYFSEDICKQLNSILGDILEKCHFTHYSNSYFDLNTFDVIVNGKAKKKFGKGYRAFLNTTVAMTFMIYLSSVGKFSPTFLLIDSPILSLKEKDEAVSDGMKSSLFQYMVDNQKYGQTIIIENAIPDINYKNANIINFTKDEKNGRYGLFYGITN